MPSSIIAPVIAGAASAGVGSLFGGSKGEAQAPLSDFRPTGFSAGGLSTGFDPEGRITVSSNADRAGAVSSLRDFLNRNADEIAGLRAKVAPGISDLRASRLQEIENARTSAVGDLRENLSRRRVFGSSFGNDAIARAELEFGQAKDKVAAESFLQELEMTHQLINEDFSLRRAAVQTGLDELNLQADLGAKLSGKATEVLGANARALAELNAKEAASSGAFFGRVAEKAFTPLQTGLDKFFRGGGGFAGAGATA